MIRLNDINKTVIDEKSINEYYSQGGMGLNTIRMIICGTYENFMYSTKEARDKDIELLDQLFEVKSIEDKSNAYPHEVDALKFAIAMSDIKKCEPTKEEYITWDEVKNSKKKIKVKMPNGDNRVIFCDDGDIIIARIIARNDYREGRIYKEDLFNALMLKKVE
jgi:hypothetical protein